MISHFKKIRKKILLLYVEEGYAMAAFRIFDLSQPIHLRDLKSGRPPIRGPSLI
jgi:hypothetical protein